MIETVIDKADRSLLWLDVTDPKKKELTQLAKDYGLHTNFVNDCLDPEHLPKSEKVGSINFMILRQYDESCGIGADDVQELTRKIAIFSNENLIITVHRKPQKFLSDLKSSWKEKLDTATVSSVLYDLFWGVVNTYEQPLEGAFTDLDRIETGSVEAQSLDPSLVKSAYYLKRKASVFRRMFRLTMDVFAKGTYQFEPSLSQDLKEKTDSLFFYSDQLLEETNNLLNLHISLSSQRTNEVVRLLTVFSLFFLPLNFIASIYGMNFDNMPELRSQYGYFAVLGLMALVAGTIYTWFRRKGWI